MSNSALDVKKGGTEMEREDIYRISLIIVISVFMIICTANSFAQPGGTPDLSGAIARVYKSIGDTQLKLYIYQPKNHKPEDRRPSIVFFSGGGWRVSRVGQFFEHSKYFASRGMVSILADYRTKSRDGVIPIQCITDAKSAIRWLRAHAKGLGIDSNRVVAAGGSAGGHLAACTALLKQFDEKNEDLKVSSVPNALVLFNPALDVSMLPSELGFGDKAVAASPLHHVSRGSPPAIIFHGTADYIVPFNQAVRFCEVMKRSGNRCELVRFEGKQHGFFHYGRGDGQDYILTTRAADEFLTSLGYLQGKPTIK
jgi:acetyl esterase